jgi:serine/threonine protein kinase
MSSTGNALPAGYVINEYRVESVLGVGGFGVTYLATDVNLNLKVALKEYLPVDFAARAEDHSISPRTPDDKDTFDWGRRRFLDEARTLASFRHPNIVRVMRFFEGNHTGYMVMEFVEGEPLQRWITTRRPLAQQAALDIVAPLLGGLAVVHKAAYLHRDIKPANIFVRADGTPVLIDFGSAREIKGGDQEVTAMVSPGYAPLEQYHAHGRQGPWSDLYALGGVMYWMLTGNKPVEAAARVRQDVMTPAAALLPTGRYTADFLAAVDWALKPNEDERPQSTADFLARLGVAAPGTSPRTVLPPADPTVIVAPPPAAVKSGMTTVAVVSGFDPAMLKRVEIEAAKHVGPIAPVLVRNAARKAATFIELCNVVAQEIEDDKTRAGFLKKCVDAERTSPPLTQPPSQPPTQTQAPTATAQPQSVSSKFTPDMLKRAETELARHIGAIAGVVVKRAAAKARDESELYLLISDEIQDPTEKKAFVRKAVIAARAR